MHQVPRGIASSDRRYPGSVDSLLEYRQNTGCRINGQDYPRVDRIESEGGTVCRDPARMPDCAPSSMEERKPWPSHNTWNDGCRFGPEGRSDISGDRA